MPESERMITVMTFNSVASLIKKAEDDKNELWEEILDDDCGEQGTKPEDSFAQMRELWQSMKSAGTDYDGRRRSVSGLSGGDGAKLHSAIEKNILIGGYFFGRVIEEALKAGESNACMRRIVAAPTAGSCGVLPAVLIPLAETEKYDNDSIVRALFVAAGFGGIIAARASISGAEGGCQAEIGSAAAMAAVALVTLKGGSPQMCSDACAMALKNLLGLVCDPVAGLVEVPCVKRNVIGAVNALSCADMALAGIKSRIPADEVIDAMRSVGELLPPSLRETAKGGLAQTPTGIKAAQKLRSRS